MNKITVGIAGALAFVIANLAAAAGEEGERPIPSMGEPQRITTLGEVNRFFTRRAAVIKTNS
ncbi:MAG: hypothetical protein LBM19_01850 [Holosporales bacterium]|jgi:hypothetical protein|nr:hypothetical protein [Holosporales bacterium]